MRVVLIVAPYYYPNSQAIRTEHLGVLYLASSLRLQGHDVSIFDPTIGSPKRTYDGRYYYGVSQGEIRERISSYNPDAVGISCHHAYSYKEAYKIATITKELNSNIITVMGGIFPTVYKGRVLSDCIAVDYVLTGESEQSFSNLLSELYLKNSQNLYKVDGLIFRKDNKVVINEKKEFINNLDSLPFPGRYLFDIKKYMNSKTVLYGLGDRPTLSLFTSRSCPYRCSFCNSRLIHGLGWRARSSENVLGEIEEIVNKYKAEHVFVMDDNFTFDIDRAKTICHGIIRKDYRFRWNTPNGISVKKIDAELAYLMKRTGCVNVCIGIESGSEYIRNNVMKKNISDEEIINAIKHFNSAKVPIGGFIILGMPGENEYHFRKTIQFVKHLKLNFIVASFATPFSGTDLYNLLIKDGIIHESWPPKMYNYNYPIFSMKDFSVSELLKRRNKLFLQFYLRHIPNMLTEFLSGRLNWISVSMLKRFFTEKVNLFNKNKFYMQ